MTAYHPFDGEALRKMELNRRLGPAWMEALPKLRWDHCLHGRFGKLLSIPKAFARLGEFSDSLGTGKRRRIEWVAFPQFYQSHVSSFHVLLKGTGRLRVKSLNDHWFSLNRHMAQTFHYKSSHSLKYFMADSVFSDFSEGRFSPGLLEARRRKISKEARSRKRLRRSKARPDA